MKKVTINLYEFEELNPKARQKAIEEHAEFLMTTIEDGETVEEEEVIESITINNYLFFEDGEMAYIIEYTGKHEKAGAIEFKLFGSVYTIQ